MDVDRPGKAGRDDHGFETTLWSAVLQAGDSGNAAAQEAWERLYRAYWYPLYAYLRRKGLDSGAAQDAIQDLFCRLMENNQLAAVAPDKGRFRSYLLAAVNHLLHNAWLRNQRQKRGGGVGTLSIDEVEAEQRYHLDMADQRTPERLFERRWALALLEQVLARLKQEYERTNRGALLAELREFLSGEHPEGGYAAVAARLQMTEGAVRVAVHRLRERYRDLLRIQVAETLGNTAEVDAELGHLMAALRE
ncbi:MAG: sigma-70 family RNA polymerase sigma factor [Verrucomicrobiales bacterium]|jgi:RNA polymerase sigma factor (sigma-70 family)|nr:sigma-70 family RNA polymerase sigma factor [Verrucomicrobiales bacterium]